MIRGLYTSGWSMTTKNKQMDVIANNLANVNTNAYKKDTVIVKSFPEMLTQRINDLSNKGSLSADIGKMQLGDDVGEVFTYFNSGNFMKTDSNMDLAIKNGDSSFFTVGVRDKAGKIQEFYTKDGAFTLDAQGQLVTKEGHLVLGTDGPIKLLNDKFSVSSDGTIVSGDKTVGKLLLKAFEDTKTLRKQGSNLMQKTEQSIESEFGGSVMQGYIEQSNVNIVKEMVDMISVTRAYEANQKVLQAQDGTLEKAVNEVGAMR